MRDWLITLEDASNTLKYYKGNDSSYIAEKISKSQSRLQRRLVFADNIDLVRDVCCQLRGYYRVKEMPQKYGQFWREKFAIYGIQNWADTLPEW